MYRFWIEQDSCISGELFHCLIDESTERVIFFNMLITIKFQLGQKDFCFIMKWLRGGNSDFSDPGCHKVGFAGQFKSKCARHSSWEGEEKVWPKWISWSYGPSLVFYQLLFVLITSSFLNTSILLCCLEILFSTWLGWETRWTMKKQSLLRNQNCVEVGEITSAVIFLTIKIIYLRDLVAFGSTKKAKWASKV